MVGRSPKKSTDKPVKKVLDTVERALSDANIKSIQPRFSPDAQDALFVGTMKWAKDAFEQVPLYMTDSRARSKWLNQFWTQEPYLAGVINSVVQIDRNRGWSLVGGRNQVLRFTDILHNWQVQPGRASWREGCGAMAQAFYTQDIGGIAEVGRQFQDGPMAGMFHLDPTRCVMTTNLDYPLKYYPPRATPDGKRMVEMAPNDYMRVASQINIDETYNGLGYSALSRCLELAITMIAVWRQEQETLFARAPKGLMLLKGISQQTWNNAMAVRDAKMDSEMRQWYGAVAVLASSGQDDVDAKLVALSQLPTGFDQQVFTNLLMYGYALCFGYDPREFWPVSSGALGTATETEAQKRKATAKGEKEFCLSLQEELQTNLPGTLHFEIDERSVDGEMAEADLQLKQAQVIDALMGAPLPAVVSPAQALTMAAEYGIIPDEWAVGGADTEATDTEDADSPGNETDNVPGTPTDVTAQMLQYQEVQRALHDFPDEPLCVYRWDGQRGRLTELPMVRKHRTVHPIAQIMRNLVAKVETEQPLPPRVIVNVPSAPAEEKPTMREWIGEQFRALADKLQPPVPQPVNVTVNAPAPATPGSVEVHNYLDGKPILDPLEEQRKRQELVDDLTNIMQGNQTKLTAELTDYLKSNQAALTDEVLADLKQNQNALAGDVLKRLQNNLAEHEQVIISEKQTKTKSIIDRIRELANGD